MKKIVPKLHLIVEFKDGKVRDELLPEAEALERFQYFVQIAVTLGFKTVRSIRVGSANHIRFEYRDIRSIVNQKGFFDYE